MPSLPFNTAARPPSLQLLAVMIDPLPLGIVMFVRMPDSGIGWHTCLQPCSLLNKLASNKLACAVILRCEACDTGTAIASNVHHTLRNGAAAEAVLNNVWDVAGLKLSAVVGRLAYTPLVSIAS